MRRGVPGVSSAPPRGALRVFGRDPVMLALLGVAAAIVSWAFSRAGSQATQAVLLWAVQIPLDISVCLLSLQVCRAPGVPAAPRRVWGALAVAAACWTVGDVIQTGFLLNDPHQHSAVGRVLQTTLFWCGLLILLSVMLSYPAAGDNRRQRWQFYLDASSVVIAGGVLIWCYGVDPGSNSLLDLLTALVGTGMVLVAVFATVKLVMGAWAAITATAAAPIIAAAFLQGTAAFATPNHVSVELPIWAVLLGLLPSPLLAMGPRIQYLQVRHRLAGFASRRPKPYSLLPYVAVTAASAAMITTLWDESPTRRLGAVAGTVVITALVVARQLLAFRENARLIDRLDNALVDLQEHEQQLREQASTDALTGLANRSAFAARVAAALAARQPAIEGSPGPDDAERGDLALLMIDLDNFKAVNDTLGHGVGDEVLIAVAQRLRDAVTPADVVARVGGDEFGVLLHSASQSGAEGAAERVLARLSPSVLAGRHELLVRASVGVARATPAERGGPPRLDMESFLRHADIAMSAAKDRGKSGWAEYSTEMSTKILETARLGAQLRDALAGGQFKVLYQPIVELPGGRIVGVEAVVRWHHAQRGTIAPAEFIPVAEATGLIVPLGRWVLMEACRAAARWPGRDGDGAPISVSVNVAGRQLQEPRFVGQVAAALRSSGLRPELLTIEVTETALLDDGTVVRTLHTLRDLGVNLALDDFGTAASSLGLVLTCPMTSLKLDRSFVVGITAVERQRAVATAVVQMAQALGLHAVAEGVETVQQAALLHGLGYRLAQGYLYARPLTPEQLMAEWLGVRPATGAALAARNQVIDPSVRAPEPRQKRAGSR